MLPLCFFQCYRIEVNAWSWLQFGQENMQGRAPCEYDGSFDEVFQLSDISWPRPFHQSLHRLRSNIGDCLCHLSRIFGDEMAHENGNVTAPLAQRWSKNREDL